MAEELLKAGLYFDDFRKLRVLEPEMAEKTNDLKDQCKDFVESITKFKEISDEFIQMIDYLAKDVEREKLLAIGARNLLETSTKHRETKQEQINTLIKERSLQLQRLKIEHQSLLKTETQQQEIIQNLILNQ